MHLSEGVLHTPVLLGGAAVALVCVMIGLKRLNSQQLPLTALFAAAFFVAVFATLSVPLCMVGIDAYDNLVAQNTMDVQELGLPVDEYGFLYIE